MRKLVWIVGHSAVGKKTLLDKWNCEEVSSFREQLGLTDTFAKCHLDKSQILVALDSGKNVIVKWQALQRNWVNEIRIERPSCVHMVLHLHRRIDEHIRAFLAKYPKSDQSTFNAHCAANMAYSEAYRGLVNRFVDVVAIDGEYLVLSDTCMTRAGIEPALPA